MKRKGAMRESLVRVMCAYGVVVFVLLILSTFIGEEAKEYSTLFALGDEGLENEMLARLVMVIVIIEGGYRLLFSDPLMNTISAAVRWCILGFLTTLTIFIYARMEGWFPLDNLQSWGFFFAFIAFLLFVCAYSMAWKTDRENKEMEEALRKLKEAEQTDEEEHEEKK